jgi:membrane associated rhomboid family serine protease
MLALPAFRGMTRKLVIAGIVAFFVVAVLDRTSTLPWGTALFALIPDVAFHRMPWQFLTYGLLAGGLLNTAFGLLFLWFIGSMVEDERGGRWLLEYVLASAVGGGLLAAGLSYAHVSGIGPRSLVLGLWPAMLALLLAFARSNPDSEMRLFFVLRVKAKHLVAIFVLFYMASVLVAHDSFSALTALCVALVGYLYLRFVPRRGLGFAGTEWWFGLRNSYYRAKRRRAAKKFTVYMRKQGKDVSLDEDGRYVDPDGRKRDLSDKRWMN